MANDGTKYFEDYILRKEGRSKWIQYWVVIRGVWMLFYTDKATNIRDNFRGSIELSAGTKCNIAKRGNYNFPFYVNTARGTHLFKCETNLKRHQWMVLIELASKGAPPIPAPSTMPSSIRQQNTQIRLETSSDRSELETPDSETDEDDPSLPPGVTLVTKVMDDLSRNEDTLPVNNVSGSTIDRSVINRAVLSTGIGGATVLQNSRLSSALPKSNAKTFSPKPSHKLQPVRGELAPRLTSSLMNGLSPLPAQAWGRCNLERPISSPSPSPTFNSKFLAHKRTPATSSQDKIRFSRHMTKSAPDIQILSLEENS